MFFYAMKFLGISKRKTKCKTWAEKERENKRKKEGEKLLANSMLKCVKNQKLWM